MIRRAALRWAVAALCAAALAAAGRVQANPRTDAAARLVNALPASLASASVPLIVLRLGEHPGFSRIVVELPAGAKSESIAQEDGLTIRAAGAMLAYRGALPRSLRALEVSGDTAILTWAHGATAHTWRMPGRLVIDVLQPTRAAISARAPLPAQKVLVPWASHADLPAPAPLRAPSVFEPGLRKPDPEVGGSGLAESKAPADSSAPWPAAASSGASTRAPGRVADAIAPRIAVAAAPALRGMGPADAVETGAEPPQQDEPSVSTLPFAASTGAAAFRRGAWGVAVFDEARPADLALDLAALRSDAALAGADIRALPAAMAVLVPLAPGQALALVHHAHGWSIAVIPDPPPSRAIRPLPKSGGLELPFDHPGRVVSMPDPDTGGLLLVGTQVAAKPGPDGPPQAVVVQRQTPSFTLAATWQGVVVEPQTDDLTLRAAASAFLVQRQGAQEGLLLADTGMVPPPGDAGRYGRRFDLPAMPLVALERRLQVATAVAALQPGQDRGGARLHVAEAMLALGMGAEAEALVRLAWNDDPRMQSDPQATAIHAAAALIAGRTGDATPIDDMALSAPGQPGLDEIQLWRALRAAQEADSTGRRDAAAAQMLAAKLPLLQSYPDPLRALLLPLALLTMVQGGETAAARRALDAVPENHTLDLARALLDEQDGHVPEALSRLDLLARSQDRDTSTRAAIQAVELRLRSHKLTATQAADLLDPLIYAWRGDGRELAVRLRTAALRMQSGQVRAAMLDLREALDPTLSQGWADQLPKVREQLAQGFADALTHDAAQPLSPLDFVAIVQDYGDLLPDGAAGLAVAERVADRLAALDLPDQAAAALGKLMDHAPAGAARAALGSRLAALQLDQRDPAAALTTLSASVAEGLPPKLVESRTMVFARATAARGDLPAAAGALAALGTPSADDLRAQLLERGGRWPEATAALQLVAGRVLPAEGKLDETQTALLLRLASAAAQAGDPHVLASLRADDLSRVPAGKSADLLRILTEGPVQTVADLPRAEAEIALARTVLK